MKSELIRDAAIEAYKTVPFYRWIYRQKNIDPHTDPIPVINKNDLFAYEDATGEKYYCSPRLGPDPILAYTAGVDGRILAVPITDRAGAGCENAMDVVPAVEHCFHGESYVIWLPKELPTHMLSLSEQIVRASNMRMVLISGRQPIEDQVRQAKEAGVTMIFDLPGVIAGKLSEANLPLDHGIKVLFSAYFPSDMVNALKAKGIETLFWHTSMDSLIGHISCLHSAPNEFHIRSRHSIHEVLQDRGELTPTGRGKYVSTIPSLPFPVVRYTNRNNVELFQTSCACHFNGLSLRFLSRDNSFKLGGTGPVLNMEDVFRYVASKPYVHRVILIIARTTCSYGHGYLFVLTEQSDVYTPLCTRGPSSEIHKIVQSGCGGSDDLYARYVFLIQLPMNSMPISLQDHKPSTYINLTTDTMQPRILPLIELIEAHGGVSVVTVKG